MLLPKITLLELQHVRTHLCASDARVVSWFPRAAVLRGVALLLQGGKSTSILGSDALGWEDVGENTSD